MSLYFVPHIYVMLCSAVIALAVYGGPPPLLFLIKPFLDRLIHIAQRQGPQKQELHLESLYCAADLLVLFITKNKVAFFLSSRIGVERGVALSKGNDWSWQGLRLQLPLCYPNSRMQSQSFIFIYLNRGKNAILPMHHKLLLIKSIMQTKHAIFLDINLSNVPIQGSCTHRIHQTSLYRLQSWLADNESIWSS